MKNKQYIPISLSLSLALSLSQWTQANADYMIELVTSGFHYRIDTFVFLKLVTFIIPLRLVIEHLFCSCSLHVVREFL